MRIELPILHREFNGENIVDTESTAVFDLDTSVYSEERWEQNFPTLAEHESLFDYIERIENNAVSERVKVACMLKAIFCFIESSAVPTYKDFAKMFNFAVPDYTKRLIDKLHTAFKLVMNGSATKN